MPNPYASKSNEHFWRAAIANLRLHEIDPVPAKRFAMADGTRISTAGSCFAQNVGKHLLRNHIVRLVIEEEVGPDEPLFSALYGNIYTVRQLLQLLTRAHGDFSPRDKAWLRNDGRYVDPFRPFIPNEGHASPEDVEAARTRHLQAVQRVFSSCDVFIFTLGLTEAWSADEDGAVFPVAPGIVSEFCSASQYRFRNFSYDECLADLEVFVARFGKTNPSARMILTVSPVPLTATYTDNHVAIATCHSKAVLRAVCSAAEERHENVFYFPSFELISGHFTRGAYYQDNLRTITARGLAHVMHLFEKTYRLETKPTKISTPTAFFDERDAEVICDEGEIVDCDF
jgi:GSCFA family protein